MKTRIKQTELNNGKKFYQPQYRRAKMEGYLYAYLIVAAPLGAIALLFCIAEFLTGNSNALNPYKWEDLKFQTQSLPEAKQRIDHFIVGCLICKLQTDLAQKKADLLKTKKITFLKYP